MIPSASVSSVSKVPSSFWFCRRSFNRVALGNPANHLFHGTRFCAKAIRNIAQHRTVRQNLRLPSTSELAEFRLAMIIFQRIHQFHPKDRAGQMVMQVSGQGSLQRRTSTGLWPKATGLPGVSLPSLA